MSWPKRLDGTEHRGRVEVTPQEPDVLKLVPPLPDVEHLNRVVQIDEHTSPLVMLALWQPTNADDAMVRSFLIAFGQRVLAAAGYRPLVRR